MGLSDASVTGIDACELAGLERNIGIGINLVSDCLGLSARTRIDLILFGHDNEGLFDSELDGLLQVDCLLVGEDSSGCVSGGVAS